MKNTKFYYLVLMILCHINVSAAPLGTLTPVPGSPFPSGGVVGNPPQVTFSPIVSGNLFAASINIGDDSISRYLVDQLTGTFTRLLPDTPTGDGPQDIAFSPVVAGGLFAAVPNAGDDNVSIYRVNTTTGAFAHLQDIGAGSTPSSIAFSPIFAGKLYAAVANFNSNNVSVYSVDQTTGAFALLSTVTITGVNPGPFDISFSPVVAGNLYVAVANRSNSTISVYSVDPTTDAFNEVVGSPFLGVTTPFDLDFSPLVAGNVFLAVTSLSNEVFVYSVNPTTGFLTQVPGSPFATGALPIGVAYSPVALGNLFAAVTNAIDNTISIYTVNAMTGAFTRVLPDTPTGGVTPFGIDFSPLTLQGKLFVADANASSDNVSVFDVTLAQAGISAISQAIIDKYC